MSKWKEKKICGQPATMNEMDISEYKKLNNQAVNKADPNPIIPNNQSDIPTTIHYKGMDDK